MPLPKNEYKEDEKFGYHLVPIEKGTLGYVSKITEEYLEFIDASKQKNIVMEFIELSDLLGAIEAYINNYNLELEDLITMTRATQRAFKNGKRK